MTRRTWFAAIAAAVVAPDLPAAPTRTTPWRLKNSWDFERAVVTVTARRRRAGLSFGLGYRLTRQQIVNEPERCARFHRALIRAMRDFDQMQR